MALTILCSGYLVRSPVGGHVFHHLQYVLGLRALGHKVIYVEDFGWPRSCYHPRLFEWTSDPKFGITYLLEFLRNVGVEIEWCYLAQDGTAYGMSREELARRSAESDLYLNLSGMNWIPELELCPRRALVDTDPVFTQIGAHGLFGDFSLYDRLFTYGENIHQLGTEIPTGGRRWLPTRQPVVLDLWPITPGRSEGAFTSVMNWSAYGDREYQGKIYGQKDRQLEPFIEFPTQMKTLCEIALSSPDGVKERLRQGGWRIEDASAVSFSTRTYQRYIQNSKAEFSVAKHAYVTTNSGWFSDRTTAYLASGRPALIEDTGFSRWLPCGAGVVPFQNLDQARLGMIDIIENYDAHCKAGREIVEAYFDSKHVLTRMIEDAFLSSDSPRG